jgi:GMP synthase (glutamine-hydrolysing)
MSTSAEKSVYILVLGHAKEVIQDIVVDGTRLQDFDRWIGNIISDPKIPVKSLQIFHPTGEAPIDALPSLDDCHGIILTGSPCDVTDIKTHGYTWAEPLIPFIQTAHQRSIPMFGICFGHQIIAHSLGGTVGYLPDIPGSPTAQYAEQRDAPAVTRAFETGTRAMFFTPAAAQCPVFGPVYERAREKSDVLPVHVDQQRVALWPGFSVPTDAVGFVAHTTHGQCIKALPAKAPENAGKCVDGLEAMTVLAYNSMDAHHAVYFGSNTWSVQFHPEFPAIAMAKYIELQERYVLAQPHILGDKTAVNETVVETQLATSLLHSWRDHVKRTSGL